jgi:hypothetical protein
LGHALRQGHLCTAHPAVYLCEAAPGARAGEGAAALAAACAWLARAGAWAAASQDRLAALVLDGCLPSQWSAFARVAADKLQGIEHVRGALPLPSLVEPSKAGTHWSAAWTHCEQCV